MKQLGNAHFYLTIWRLSQVKAGWRTLSQSVPFWAYNSIFLCALKTAQSASFGAHTLKGGRPRRGLTPRRTDWPSDAIDFNLTTDSFTSQKIWLSITPRRKPQNAELNSDFCHFCSTAPMYVVFIVDNWAVMQPVVVFPYRHFGTNCRSNLQGSRIERMINNRFFTVEDETDKLSRNVGK